VNGDLEHRLRARIDTVTDERDQARAALDDLHNEFRQWRHRAHDRIRWYRASRNKWRLQHGQKPYDWRTPKIP